ncbi:L,D-transpeptidase family protein, partial [bacterium]|nr:L,D-transpeptidase family protein [bacterium]
SGGSTVYKFTEKELDNETDFYYFGARYYDPEVGRFISPDPLAEKLPSWSPYVYVSDNPLKYIDPTGEYQLIVNVRINRIFLVSREGNIVGSWEARTTGQHRNRMLEYGDTPYGTYRVARGPFNLERIKKNIPYGTRFIGLEATGGEALRSGRTGIGIHGGGSGLADPFRGDQGWVITEGCIRMQNEDIETMSEEVRTLVAAGDEEGTVEVGADVSPPVRLEVVGGPRLPKEREPELIHLQ